MRSLNFLFIGAFSIGASLAVIYYEFFILRSIRSANVNTHSSCYASGWGANKIYSSDRELLIEANMKYFPPQDRYDSSEMFLGTKLNRIQVAFIKWNAVRLGITEPESLVRFSEAMALFAGGFAGGEFREYLNKNFMALKVLANDAEDEILNAYRIHAPLNTLRLVNYDISKRHRNPLLAMEIPRRLVEAFGMENDGPLVIIDFGAGMAQSSFVLAEALRASYGRQVHLHLFDVPTPRKELLTYICDEFDRVPCTFHDIIEGLADPPPFPSAHLLIAQEVLEHVYPATLSRIQKEIDASILPGGLVVTNLGNHNQEFTHVNPKLSVLKEWFSSKGFQGIEGKGNFLLQRGKP